MDLRALAKLAFEAHLEERRKDRYAAFIRGLAWEVLTPEEQRAWVRVAEVMVQELRPVKGD